MGGLALLCLAWFFLCRKKSLPAKSMVKGGRGAMSWRAGAGPATAVVSNPLSSREGERAALTAAPREVELSTMGALPTEATAPAPALPPGWLKHGPDAEGDSWYVHTATGETSWT